MNLLLCGHGYLGQAIASLFREHGWQVSSLSLKGCHDSLACDVGDPAAVARVTRAIPPPDFMIHCASSNRGGPDAYRHIYQDGCHNLTETFRGVPLLFTSSTSVYAQTDGTVVDESSLTEPDRETGRILLATEQQVLAAGGIVARLAGIYGPGRSVILSKFLRGEAVIEDDGGRVLNQVHRDDAAAAILHLCRLARAGFLTAIDRALFNVADSTPLTQLETYTALARMFGRPLPPHGPRDLTRKRGWTHKRVSNAKLVATGWQPQHASFLDAALGIAPTLGPETAP